MLANWPCAPVPHGGEHRRQKLRPITELLFRSGGGRLILGDNVFINYNNWFDLKDDIVIGSGVSIAMNCQFINGSHEIGGPEHRAAEGKQAPIVIGDGAWIGAGSTIMMGVTIGNGTIIGAGSLVLSDCEPNSIYIGRPAKLLRRIED
jgi:maltose O-acetyltransferase